jgi:hypothetical protein
VDALKEQIESLKRVSTAGSVASCTSTATGASPPVLEPYNTRALIRP